MTNQEKLQDMLKEFSKSLSGGVSSQAYVAIKTAIDSSLTLEITLEQAIASNKLTSFTADFVNAAQAGATYISDQKTIYIPVTTGGALATLPTIAILVDALGHEAQHAIASTETSRGWDTFVQGVRDTAALSGLQEYTQLLIMNQNVHAMDEAIAEIVGWNAMIDYAHFTWTNISYASLRQIVGSITRFFLKNDGSPVDGLQLNADFSVAFTPTNIAAIVATYFYKSNPGFQFNFNYPEWYGRYDLQTILNISGGKKVAIDFSSLNIDPAKIQASNTLYLASGQSASIYDPITYKTYTFQNSGSGITRTETKPIITPHLEATEILNYDTDGNLTSTDHEWADSDGGRGYDTLSASGNYYESHTNNIGDRFYSYRDSDGGWGNGFTKTSGDTHNESHYSDGSYTINSSQADGTYSHSYKNSDGSYGMNYLLSDGTKHNESHQPDGSSSSSTDNDSTEYHQSSYTTSTGGHGYNESKADGSRHSENYSPDGSSYVSDLSSDGTLHQEAHSPDGSFYIHDKDADSNESTETMDADKNYHSSWKKNDNSHGEKDIFKNGDIKKTEYSSSGEHHVESIFASGNYLDIKYNINNKMTSIDFKEIINLGLDINVGKMIGHDDGSVDVTSTNNHGGAINIHWQDKDHGSEHISSDSGFFNSTVNNGVYTASYSNKTFEDRVDSGTINFDYNTYSGRVEVHQVHGNDDLMQVWVITNDTYDHTMTDVDLTTHTSQLLVHDSDRSAPIPSDHMIDFTRDLWFYSIHYLT